jgi:alpha-galactosidase
MRTTAILVASLLATSVALAADPQFLPAGPGVNIESTRDTFTVPVAAAAPAATLPANSELLPNAVWLEDLNINIIKQGWGTAHARQSVDGHPIKLRNVVYPHGVGSHAPAEIRIPLNGNAVRFVATAGIDDEVGDMGSTRVAITVDDRPLVRPLRLTGNGQIQNFDVDLTGAKEMTITLDDLGDNNSTHLDLANAQIVLTPSAAAAKTQLAIAPPLPPEPPVTLSRTTDPDGQPHINGARITGGTPGKEFLFLVPATGTAPLTYSAENLPAGLKLDPTTGIITGRLQEPGVTPTMLHVKNAAGEANRQLLIVAGKQKLALTPPLGWNSWNCWGTSVTQQKVQAAADGFTKSGLAAHGFTYVNIDDGWEIPVPRVRRGGYSTGGSSTAPAAAPTTGPALRAPDGTILVNNKFPDMKALGEYIHSKGLKFGIYSSPGPSTCGGYTASWQHEEQDARTWASWGVDYIKYDWCSYSNVAPHANANDPGAVAVSRNPVLYFTMDTLKKPYRDIRVALDKLDRDMVLSLCQYGWGNVWEWGAAPDIGGNVWRATGDINDTWNSMYRIGFIQNGHEKFSGPGHWNDTDMLVVGKVGWSNTLHQTHLTQNEQLTHISLWSILAAPMLLGCDLTQLDEFTTSLMSNDEVLAVSQDPIGKMGHRLSPAELPAPNNPASAPQQVWIRELWDGSIAVGLFNLANQPADVSVSMKDLGLSGPQPARDLWQLKNLPPITDTFTTQVPRHGVVLLKVGTAKSEADAQADLIRMYTK